MRIPMGMETEYSLMFLTQDGKFINPADSVSWFLGKVARACARPRLKQPGFLRRLRICGRGFSNPADEQILWLGATGGKIYGDLGSTVLEYSGPECGSVDQVAWADRGGDRVLHILADYICRRFYYGKKRLRKILVVKNNSDIIRGAAAEDTHSYGSHENYQIAGEFLKDCYLTDELDNDLFIQGLASLLVARILVSGSGGIFRDRVSGLWSYVISPRAALTKCIFSVASNKSMISCRREEHHCVVSGMARLHLPVGDSNMSLRAVALRFSLVNTFLCLWEELRRSPPEFPLLCDPLAALHAFSKNTELTERASLRDGREIGQVELLREWFTILLRFARGRKKLLGAGNVKILENAQELVSAILVDRSVVENYTEWGEKQARLNYYCQREGAGLSNWKARCFDALYCEIGPDGFYNRYQKKKVGVRAPPSFSKEEMNKAVWRHRALPRAELRKRFLSVCARARRGLGDLEWGTFYLPQGEEVGVRPFGHRSIRIENYLRSI